jgi:hypothetical protein
MTTKPENCEELTRLIPALLEGRLSDQERARLGALLQADPHARRLYMQMVDQEVELSCLLVPAAVGGETPAKILPFIQPLPALAACSSQRRPWSSIAAAAAGLLLVGTAIGLILAHRPPETNTVTVPKSAHTEPVSSVWWNEDFEKGTLRGWTGSLTSSNLPAGSRFGITAVEQEYPGQTAYVIQLPADWHQGLFALTTGSTLNVRFLVGNQKHINVFMHTIPVDPGVNGYEMYQLDSAPFWGKAGEWRTASIPFSQFKRKVVVKPKGTREFAGGPPSAGELVTVLSFSSVDEIELVIDAVWVTSNSSLRDESSIPDGLPR